MLIPPRPRSSGPLLLPPPLFLEVGVALVSHGRSPLREVIIPPRPRSSGPLLLAPPHLLAEMQKFETKMVGGELKFVCDKCDHTANTNRAVKGHWNKKHRREAEEEEDASTHGNAVDDAESKKLKVDTDKPKPNWRDRFDANGDPLDESVMETSFDESVAEIENTQDISTSTPKPKAKMNQYDEDEMSLKLAELESLKETVKEKEELLSMAYAKINSLEEEGIRKTNEIEKTDIVFEKLEERLKKSEDPKYKKELNVKAREIKNLNQKLADNLKKFRDEINLRAKAEAELKIKDSTIEALKDVIAMQKTSIQQAGPGRPPSPQGGGGRGQEKRLEPCWDFLRQGSCFRGNFCKFTHHPPGRNDASSQPASGGKPDCKYWLEGYCRKTENLCFGMHNPSMCGTQRKQSSQTGGNNFNNTNFVETLAKAVSQSLAGVQHQMAGGPSRGQQQAGTQPQQQTSNSQLNTNMNQQQQQVLNNQNMMMNQQQLAEGAPARGQQTLNNQQNTMMNQQQQMMPFMMLPNGQSMYFPAQQGMQGPGH